jgi:hypothetical protein
MVTESGLDLCQGTLVVHVDAGFGAECTEPECVDLDQVRHVLTVDCSALSGGCECTESLVIVRAS